MSDTIAPAAADFAFWPPDLTAQVPTAPIAVLKRAAAELGQRTRNLLEGRVETSQVIADGRTPEISHSFLIRAPGLDNYTVELFEARHGSMLYPVRLSGEPLSRKGSKWREVKDEAELAEAVRLILASDYVRKVVAGMLAQVQS